MFGKTNSLKGLKIGFFKLEGGGEKNAKEKPDIIQPWTDNNRTIWGHSKTECLFY